MPFDEAQETMLIMMHDVNAKIFFFIGTFVIILINIALFHIKIIHH